MLQSYYHNPEVRSRILEFLGGDQLEDVSAVYFTADDDSADVQFRARPLNELWNCLDQGLDIGRSLWDRKYLVAHLDIEYVNFDFPGEPYLFPHRTFELQRPVVRAIENCLSRRGLAPLHLLSGRGHHFVWQICRSSEAFERLKGFGSQAAVSEQLPSPGACSESETGSSKDEDSLEVSHAYQGLGMVMEFLAHEVLSAAGQECRIPIELTAVEAGPTERGREIVALDISEYADPLHSRGIRMPFSAYLKPQQQRGILGQHVVESLSPMFIIPLSDMEDFQGVEVMRDVSQVIELAQRVPTSIPVQSEAMENLIGAYEGSPLAQFHREFYHHPQEHSSNLQLNEWPACASNIIEYPNDLLLKPVAMQHIVRMLLAEGWGPQEISGLIRSKYKQDYCWGDRWTRYDARLRAEFFTRIFTGMIATGLDGLIDFNCQSTQEKQYCPVSDCPYNLLDWKEALLWKWKRPN